MKIVSCGDSFFYGTDLADQEEKKIPPDGHSKHTWPAVISSTIEAEYCCYACPGVGNFQILQQIIQAYHDHGDTATYFINWTWIDRFDYVSTQDEKWHTVRPSLDNPRVDEFYYRNFHSELADKFHSLVYISQAQEILKTARYVMTYMDYLLLDQRWHAPNYIVYLQHRVRSNLKNFNGKNFLDWSRDCGYAISEKWHPLEQAHKHAAEHWLTHL
jgi:hypothetical protein